MSKLRIIEEYEGGGGINLALNDGKALLWRGSKFKSNNCKNSE